MVGGISGWFSSEGRISRKDYWLQVILPGTALVLVVPALSLFGGALRAPLRAGLVGMTMFYPVILATLFAYGQRVSALTTRRYHDLGKKGAWRIKSPGLNLIVMLAAIPVAFFIFMASYLLFIAALMATSQSMGLIVGVLGLVAVVLGVSLWRFYQLACLPGMSGENEYGPDPLDPPPSGARPSGPAGSSPPQAPMVVRVARPPANAGFGRKRA